MSVDSLRNKGKDFWKKVAKAAEEGKIPYIKVQSDPIPLKDLPFGRKRGVRPDPERRWSHFRTRCQGGAGRPRCMARGCWNDLKINDLLCCSPECYEYLKGSCERVLEIMREQPEFVYMDFLKGMGMVRPTKKEYTEKDDELEGLDGNRYRGFVRRDDEGPGVGVVHREEIPSTHLLSPRGHSNPYWLKGCSKRRRVTPPLQGV